MKSVGRMKSKCGNKVKRALCLVLSLLIIFTCVSSIMVLAEDVNYSALCKITPKSQSFKTGEAIQFALSAQYSTPSNSMPDTVTFSIPIPVTEPEIQLPMFYKTGTGDYEGVPMAPLSFQGVTINLYLVDDGEGKRHIEFTLTAGDTISGVITMSIPNGVSAAIDDMTLTPSIISDGDYGDNNLLQPGSTDVIAEFVWSDVKKTGSVDNIGAISSPNNDIDRITYDVTAESNANSATTGQIFTDHYVLEDTVRFNGVYYLDGELTQSEAEGRSTILIGGVPTLEIDKPLSKLEVNKIVESGVITGFHIKYSETNDTINRMDGTAEEIPNLDFSADLLTRSMKVTSGLVDTSIVNTAEFDAYSKFYDSEHTGNEYHHNSIAEHDAYTTDKYQLEKLAFEDEACTEPATYLADGQFVWYKIIVHNDALRTGPFYIKDILPGGITYVSATVAATSVTGNEVIWNNITIPSGGTYEITVKTKFSAIAITDPAGVLKNTASLYFADTDTYITSDSVNCTFRSGEVNDSDIIYTKGSNRPSAKRNDTITYTITAKNKETNAAAKMITITDKWPGNSVTPTAISGSENYELFDDEGNVYTIEDVKNDASIIITKIKIYNVIVPRNGVASVKISGVVKTDDPMIKNEIIGSNGASMVATYSVGLSISKKSHEYDQNGVLGKIITNTDISDENDVVCYELIVKNTASLPVSNVTITDKLPAGMTLTSGSLNGVAGMAILKRGETYSALSITGEEANNYTSGGFNLAPGETVTVYIFGVVTSDLIDNSSATGGVITNYAYASMNGLKTGDATSLIYVNIDQPRYLDVMKSVTAVPLIDDDYNLLGSPFLKRDGTIFTPSNSKYTTVSKGDYAIYCITLCNRGDPLRRSIPIYEVMDTLPAGMEFVGVFTQGVYSDYYQKTLNSKPRNILDELIFSGETKHWTNREGNAAKKEADLTVNYDEATRKVSILVNGGSTAVEDVFNLQYYGGYPNNSAYFFILVKVDENNDISTYENLAECRVPGDVEGYNSVKYENTTEEGFKVLGTNLVVNAMKTVPGIDKSVIGHYFTSNEIPASVDENLTNITPGETLRYTIRLLDSKSISKNASESQCFSLQDFSLTDYLPKEYRYKPGSTSLKMNAVYNLSTGLITNETYVTQKGLGAFEPDVVEILPDGRTKLVWNFTGADMRLMSPAFNETTIGFEHLLTYDTVWNEEMIPSYGNYTNTATVVHSADFDAVSLGTPNFPEKAITASANVSVFGSVGTTAYKEVTNSKSQTASGTNPDNNKVAVAGVGDTVRYTLSVKNATAAAILPLSGLTIIDELPRGEDDTGVVNRVERNSEFSVLFGNTPNVTVKLVKANNTEEVVSPTMYTITYGNSSGGLNSGGDWGGGENPTVDWQAESNGKNAIRILFSDDFGFSSAETVKVSFQAVVGDDADPLEIAWNSFGYKYQAMEGGIVQKIYSEPQKVGIFVPGGTLSVSKKVVNNPEVDTENFTFVLKDANSPAGNIKYKILGDDTEYRTGSDGKFVLQSGQTAKFFVYTNRNYTVEEIDIPEGYECLLVSPMHTGDGTATGAKFSFKKLSDNQYADVSYINKYIVIVPSGVNLEFIPYAMIFSLALGGCGYVLWRRKKAAHPQKARSR